MSGFIHTPGKDTSVARFATQVPSDGTNYAIGLPSVGGNAQGTFNTSGGTVNYFPFLTKRAIQVTEAWLEVTTANGAGGTGTLAIWTADASWQPVAAVSTLSSTIATDTTGVKSVTGLAVDLSAGRHLLAWRPESGFGSPVTLRTLRGSCEGFAGVNPTMGASMLIRALTVAGSIGANWSGLSGSISTVGFEFGAFLRWTDA